jgi:uncharacterized protein YdiU (UPF0061 family)
VAQVSEVIDVFPSWYDAALLSGQRVKLGILDATPADDIDDTLLVQDWLVMLQSQAVDFTLAWRHLAAAAEGHDALLRELFVTPAALDAWLTRWRERCIRDEATVRSGTVERVVRMRLASPWIIPRNQRVEQALAAASDDGDLAPFKRLLAALREPFSQAAELAPYAMPAPVELSAGYQTFCGT